MNSAASYGIALLFALLLHALVIGVMSINWNESLVHYDDIKPYYIEAQVVSENPFTAKEQRADNKERSRREQRLERRRQDELNFQQQLKDWEAEDRQRREAAAREPEPVTVPQPAPRTETTDAEPEGPDEEAVRSSFEAGLTQALIDELNLRKAVTDDEKAMAYVAQIQREIIQNWSRPPSARNGMQAILRVRLFPTGELMDVKVEDSSGNDAFDRSAMQAVRKAGRFMVPEDSRQFERSFREFTLLFRPDDLRL